MGKDPPAFDILYWNADATNLPAGLHRDFLRARARQRPHQAGRARPCSARRSTSRRSPSTPTSSPGSPTTSRRGRAPTVDAACSAPSRASCSPPAGTSPRSSTRRATRRRATGQRRQLPEEPEAWLRERDPDAGHVVGRLDGRGWASARAAEAGPQAAGRQGLQAARRRAGQLRDGVARAARPGQRRPAALRAPRRRRAAAADHGLHDQLGGVRARARPLRRALRVHHLRQPRLGPLGRAAAPTSMPSWPPTPRGCCARSASRARTCTGSRWAG